MNKETQDFKVIVGDWANDGHGRTHTHIVRIPKSISQEQLFENYTKNKETLGFGYNDFACSYEDGTITRKQLDGLEKLGLHVYDVASTPAGEEIKQTYFDTKHEDFYGMILVNRLDSGEYWDPETKTYIYPPIPAPTPETQYVLEDQDWYEQILKIAMFMIGQGIPDFRWELVSEEAIPTLIGGGGNGFRASLGIGLLS